MKVLFDQGPPVPLRRALTAHDVCTALEMSWSNLSNGDLLRAAEGSFDVLVTTDQSLRYQQNLTGRRLAIVVLSTTSWPRIQRHLHSIVATIDAVGNGGYVEIEIPPA